MGWHETPALFRLALVVTQGIDMSKKSQRIKYKYSTTDCISSTPCPFGETDLNYHTEEPYIRYVGATSCEECGHFIRDCRRDRKDKYVECANPGKMNQEQ